MKKVLALVLALAMVLCLFAACSKGGNDTTEPAENNDAETQVADAIASGVEDGVLTVALECAYAP